MFRSRDTYDIDFDLALTAQYRVGLAGRIARFDGHSVRGASIWAPQGARARAAVVMAAGAAIAPVYRAVGSLGSDKVTYMPVARKHFNDAYLLGDLPLCEPDSAQAREPVRRSQHVEVGFNHRLSNVLAALGSSQLATLERRVARGRVVHQHSTSTGSATLRAFRSRASSGGTTSVDATCHRGGSPPSCFIRPPTAWSRTSRPTGSGSRCTCSRSTAVRQSSVDVSPLGLRRWRSAPVRLRAHRQEHRQGHRRNPRPHPPNGRT